MSPHSRYDPILTIQSINIAQFQHQHTNVYKIISYFLDFLQTFLQHYQHHPFIVNQEDYNSICSNFINPDVNNNFRLCSKNIIAFDYQSST